MQSSITNSTKVTPAEVKFYFSKLKFDEIPFVEEQIELKQIVIKPKISDKQKDLIREKLNNFRNRVYNGEDFKVLAALYSDDPGTSNNGGELGFMNRGQLVAEFERAAFKLKDNEISEVVETKYGFHVIQMISRRGEEINVRHILLKPKVTSLSLKNAKDDISKIKLDLDSNLISFEDAIIKFSEDESKNNGGLLINPSTGSSKFTSEQLNPSVKYIVENMSINDISTPSLTNTENNEQSYRIIMLYAKTAAHQANIIDDYTNIQEFAMNNKKQDAINNWISDNLSNTFVKLSDEFYSCEFYNKWIK
jgi:peptidyl-prolyl cis-trans isomerase SurA